MRMRALDRKLWRDLLEMRGQAIAVAAVVASGVAMFVMYLSNFDSLRRTLDAYYTRQRFADVFASLERAPRSLADRIAEIPGVTALETRVVVDVVLDVPGVEEPARGHLVSVPEAGRPVLNDLVLRRGRWIDPARADEVLASEVFCEANRVGPGDTVGAIVNGRRRTLRIVGVALSPEFVYTIPPGELVPDNRRYGVFWMDRRALASAFRMEGGFNDLTLRVTPGASVAEIVTGLDRLLAPFGGRGAVPRALQFSNWTIQNELAQLQSMGLVIPAMFLFIAAFILNVAMARALALQRPQIAALKALGYGNGELAWHYLKFAALIAAGGAVAGVACGAWLGTQMLALYNDFFRFPLLIYRLSPMVVVGSVTLSLVSGILGALTAVRRAVRIPPAEAMRPEPPATYRHSIVERAFVLRRLSHLARMVLRNLERQPMRALASVTGIAFGCAIVVVGFLFVDLMEGIVRTQFSVVQRQDVALSFVEPLSAGAMYGVARLPGVLYAEPQRVVPIRIRAGHRTRNTVLTGLPARATLQRVADLHGRVVSLPPWGLVMSRMLGEILGVGPGDRVIIDVLEGQRPTTRVEVAALVDDALGLSVYMEIDALHRLLREDRLISGATLAVDAAAMPTLDGLLKRMPAVAGVSSTEAVVRNFREIMARNMNIMTVLNVIFATVIASGVVYNAARISLSERSRELASLRVLGFTRVEISTVLLGELAVLTVAALPPGMLMGYGLGELVVTAFATEMYRFVLSPTPPSFAYAGLIVVGAATLSGLAVRRRLDHLDLVAVLKTRE